MSNPTEGSSNSELTIHGFESSTNGESSKARLLAKTAVEIATAFENVSKYAAPIAATVAALSVIYNFAYFSQIDIGLLWLLSFEDYVSAGFQITGALFVLSPLVFLLSLGFSVLLNSALFAVLSRIGMAIASGIALILKKVNWFPRSKNVEQPPPQQQQPLGEYPIAVLYQAISAFASTLVLIGLAFLTIRSIINGTSPFLNPYGIAITILFFAFSGSLFLREFSLGAKIVLFAICFIAVGTYFMASLIAKASLSSTNPTFAVEYHGVLRPAILLRGLSHVVIVRLIDIDQLVVYEWQEFKKGAFKLGVDGKVVVEVGANVKADKAPTSWSWSISTKIAE